MWLRLREGGKLEEGQGTARRTVARIGDRFDALMDRRGGQVVTLAGVVSIVTGVAGYLRLLPPPFSVVPPPLNIHCIGCPQSTSLGLFLMWVGGMCVMGGIAWTRDLRKRKQVELPRKVVEL